jgi:hypothetical protein
MKTFAFIAASFATVASFATLAPMQAYAAGGNQVDLDVLSSVQDLNAPFRVAGGETCSIDQPVGVSVNAQVCGNDADVDIL